MEEILHHPGFRKPFETCDISRLNWCKIFPINSKYFLISQRFWKLLIYFHPKSWISQVGWNFPVIPEGVGILGDAPETLQGKPQVGVI